MRDPRRFGILLCLGSRSSEASPCCCGQEPGQRPWPWLCSCVLPPHPAPLPRLAPSWQAIARHDGSGRPASPRLMRALPAWAAYRLPPHCRGCWAAGEASCCPAGAGRGMPSPAPVPPTAGILTQPPPAPPCPQNVCLLKLPPEGSPEGYDIGSVLMKVFTGMAGTALGEQRGPTSVTPGGECSRCFLACCGAAALARLRRAVRLSAPACCLWYAS